MKNEKKLSEKVVSRKQAREAWLNDTRTITALCKWANGDGSRYVEDYLSKLENAPTLRKLCNVKNVINALAELDKREGKRKYLVDKDGNKRNFTLLRTCSSLRDKWRKSKISQVGTGVLC
jgi:hypothetical protein